MVDIIGGADGIDSVGLCGGLCDVGGAIWAGIIFLIFF
ncbi:hypothetical protein HFN_0583 [Helicobacter fennelliae MRY12-0050]|uniref:Uncharacterized protein n=1 Tax=Helicobacter fennelliae MRY12-0050 TaxID=1325130 RepID=T1DWJ2_9HELI|nr:hypothetical protein HFN_0583 [Helicobacter fennelliae MRY12-0050]